ncbi:Nuclear envelope phosphatase-regulatory subunit 1, partial [Fragariocoptes setiger]
MNVSGDLQSCEDLKAFERRLTEIVACVQPQTQRWRIILLITFSTTVLGAIHWLLDPQTKEVGLIESLSNHMFFTTSAVILILLFFCGIHKRVVAPKIVVSRIKQVLSNFNMSCDPAGRLILGGRKRASINRMISTTNSRQSDD